MFVTDAEELRDQLLAADVPATIDPAWASTNRPCVLVTPPAIDWTARSLTWRLAALSAHGTGSLAALVELGDLIERVADVLDVEGADPASYALTPETGTVPAYLIRVTTSH